MHCKHGHHAHSVPIVHRVPVHALSTVRTWVQVRTGPHGNESHTRVNTVRTCMHAYNAHSANMCGQARAAAHIVNPAYAMLSALLIASFVGEPEW